MKDPYFITLVGVASLALLYMMVCSIYEAVNTWRKIGRYAGQLPPDDHFAAEALCPILGIDADRLHDFTRKEVISRYEAERIIRELVTQEWCL